MLPVTREAPVAETRHPAPWAPDADSAPASTKPAQQNLRLTRRLRDLLDELVTAYEQATGLSVGDQFSVREDSGHHIFLDAGRSACRLPRASRAHRAALRLFELLRPSSPASGPDRACAVLSVNHLGITFTQGIQ